MLEMMVYGAIQKDDFLTVVNDCIEMQKYKQPGRTTYRSCENLDKAEFIRKANEYWGNDDIDSLQLYNPLSFAIGCAIVEWIEN